LTEVEDLFRADSAKRDALYRRAVVDPRLGDTGRIVLLALLGQPTGDDFAEMMRIWQRAVGEPVRVRLVDETRSTAPQVYANVNACAVACALARHRRIDELLRIDGEARAGDDLELRGEIAFAAAQLDDRRALTLLADYVRDAWGRAARAPGFEQSLQTELDRARREGRPVYLGTSLDSARREDEIERGLELPAFGPAGDVSVPRALLEDRTLHPLLRLRLLEIFGCTLEALAPQARSELDALRRQGGSRVFHAYAAYVDEQLSRREAEYKRPRRERLRQMFGMK
jgi:hypothetical protein